MPTKQFIEILFPEDVRPEDLDVVTPAAAGQPGRVKLGQARMGKPHPNAPNSAPLFSRTGAKSGFVASAELSEPPYTHCYWLDE